MSVIQPERVSALCGGSHDTRMKGQPLSSITVTATCSGGLGLTEEGETNDQRSCCVSVSFFLSVTVKQSTSPADGHRHCSGWFEMIVNVQALSYLLGDTWLTDVKVKHRCCLGLISKWGQCNY